MFRKSLRVAMLAAVITAPLLAAGCSSNDSGKPYSVTGGNTLDEQERKERMRWTDDKNHYRMDLRGQGGPTLRDVP